MFLSHKERVVENYLRAVALRGMKPGLKRMQSLMRRFEHPEKKFKSVHVTGTNGKGSVCAMLESIFRSAGLKTGFYCSPHLVDLRERIRVSGKVIDLDSFSYWLREIRMRAHKIEPELTYFELMTAIAFCYFAEKNVELAVVEVGLGGRLDATNILPSPEVCIVTNVALEHAELLGKTVFKIAREKAGIVKENSVCVTGASGLALKAIREICSSVRHQPVVVHLPKTQPQKISLIKFFNSCALKGKFQLQNILLVLKTIDVLRHKKWIIPDRALKEGLRHVVWPGRFDWRICKSNTGKFPILLDGAHNPAATEELVSAIKTTGFIKKNCLLIFNALKDKNVKKMVQTLLQRLKVHWVFVPSLKTNRTSSPQDLKKLFLETFSKHKEQKQIAIKTFGSVPQMWSNFFRLNRKKRRADLKGDWILVTGSFYLIGETLKLFSAKHKWRMK